MSTLLGAKSSFFPRSLPHARGLGGAALAGERAKQQKVALPALGVSASEFARPKVAQKWRKKMARESFEESAHKTRLQAMKFAKKNQLKRLQGAKQEAAQEPAPKTTSRPMLLTLLYTAITATTIHFAHPLPVGGLRPAAATLANSQDRPRLIPLVAAELGYSENSSVNILCTVSQGHHETLQFDWFKDGKLLASGGGGGSDDENESANDEPQGAGRALALGHSLETGGPHGLQIEKSGDHSLLRIGRVLARHAGRYTCAAKNQFGSDSSSVSLLVNGEFPPPPLSNSPICCNFPKSSPRELSECKVGQQTACKPLIWPPPPPMVAALVRANIILIDDGRPKWLKCSACERRSIIIYIIINTSLLLPSRWLEKKQIRARKTNAHTHTHTNPVKLQWIKEPAKEMIVSLNQELKLDCLAQGEPRPTMRWLKLAGDFASSARHRLERQSQQQQQAKLAELVGRNQLASTSSAGELLFGAHSEARPSGRESWARIQRAPIEFGQAKRAIIALYPPTNLARLPRPASNPIQIIVALLNDLARSLAP